MNWETRTTGPVVRPEDDCCPHLSVGDTGYMRHREMDSFGPVTSYVSCKDCEELARTESEDRTVIITQGGFLDVMKVMAKTLLHAAGDNVLSDNLGVVEKAIEIGFFTENSQAYQPLTIIYYRLNPDEPTGVLVEDGVYLDRELLVRFRAQLEELFPILGLFTGLVDTAGTLLNGTMVGDGYYYPILNPNAKVTFAGVAQGTELLVRPGDAYEFLQCDQCAQSVPRYLTREWKWYDFYPAQGDEPMVLCNECNSSDEHRERRARDEADRRAEFGEADYDDEDDNNTDWPDADVSEPEVDDTDRLLKQAEDDAAAE